LPRSNTATQAVKDKTTPMIAQYHRVKGEHPEAILLFRVGDFYETFFEDAVEASRILGITLTSRNHGREGQVPLAGIPHHALERYLSRLLRAGKKVAICDQLENAQLAKGLVRRGITEVITPGTAMRSSLLDAKANVYLASINPREGRCGLAVVSLTTGEFRVTELLESELRDEILRLSPAEILLPQSMLEKECALLSGIHSTKTPIEDYLFSTETATRKLLEQFKTASLEGFGCQDLPQAIGAAGVALEYLKSTQMGLLKHVDRFTTYRVSDYLLLDEATQRNLEIVASLSGRGEATLVSVLDHTRTPMGARLIRRWLLSPLYDVQLIKRRQDGVETFFEDTSLSSEIQSRLSKLPDLERLTGRVGTLKANPRDIKALQDALKVVYELKGSLVKGYLNQNVPLGSQDPDKVTILHELTDALVELPHILDLLERSLEETAPLETNLGGIIKKGYSLELDGLKAGISGMKSWIAGLEKQERQRTGIGSLKVGFNSVFGYYIEITKPNLNQVPPEYIRKQTVANGERFITQDLKEAEEKVLGAEEKINRLEENLFGILRERVAEEAPCLRRMAEALGILDVLLSLAQAARENRYVRPVVNDSFRLSLKGSRHPVVEQVVEHGRFVSNDVIVDTSENQILIITGPNMAGKSTYLRQIALIVIMAQTGSFVPAEEAEIGLVDRIFTRIGASDDLARGVSTFLAEMQETAKILNSATPRSLILLDEIGRGTATFDGLALAWAVTEVLHNEPKIKARTLFATHYHELTDLARELTGIKNYNAQVKEWGEEITFLHKIGEGKSDRSYGIQVARLAGIPQSVLERAKEILANLERDEFTPEELPRLARGEHAPDPRLVEQLTIFSEHPVLEELRNMNVDKLAPLEALNLLASLHKKANS
jgi:DNA mismatch repair protein MutS